MPKTTFLNLPEEKRERLVEIFKETVLKKSIAKQTVTDFVKASKIPRGSFYQYFDDLNDLYEYIFTHTIEGYQVYALSRLNTRDMPFFEYMDRIFLLDINYLQENNHYKILRKFLTHSTLSGMATQRMEEKRKAFASKVLSQLDTMSLEKTMTIEDIEELYVVISSIKVQYTQKVLRGVLDTEEAYHKYLKMLDIIRRGVKES